PGPGGLVVGDVGAEVAVVGGEVVVDGGGDGLVGGAVEQPHRVAGEVLHRVDAARRRPVTGQLRQFGRGLAWHEGVHARVQGGGEAVLRAVVGAGGEDAGALEDVGVGDVELVRHEPAGRQSADVGRADVVLAERT